MARLAWVPQPARIVARRFRRRLFGGAQVGTPRSSSPNGAVPRWGPARPHSHLLALLRDGEATYREWLERFRQHIPALRIIPASEDVPASEPTFLNPFFGILDAMTLYGFVAELRPLTIIEIGSGHSTRFAARSIRDHKLQTRLLCIDPEPRADIAGIADLRREPLERVDLKCFERLGANDIIFIDGSHRCAMNSDVTVFFLEILPRLPAGTVVHFHDIWWPFDYPRGWADLDYNEQYVVGVLLLAGAPLEILLPSMYVAQTPHLFRIVAPLWDDPRLASCNRAGGSFWFRWLGRSATSGTEYQPFDAQREGPKITRQLEHIEQETWSTDDRDLTDRLKKI